MPSDLTVYENRLHNKGYSMIAGVDEAGRGPLAGPVVAGAVVLGKWFDPDIKDSKKLSPKKREMLFNRIIENAESIGIGIVDNETIDQINILNATKRAMHKALANLHIDIDFLLIDAVKLNIDIPQLAIIGGDNISISIAAGSIIAKVCRDRIMLKLHEKFPEYQFDRHKGYGTAIHTSMLQKYGPCSIHRRSFSPVRKANAGR
ncbi:MAG: ribonuclease HII [Spirochaetes bacterium]|nr:ribonuclease HII [Spirochaetota bacterium]MCK5267344.1 ribonuclease HII [Spirochaetota bacterium]